MSYNGIEVAVIGMSCKLPGANSKEEFWENLMQSNEGIRTLSDDELQACGVDASQLTSEDYIKRRGVLKDIKYFDHNFFSYNNREAELMDPQSRILHEYAYYALEDAGYANQNLDRSIGLYLSTTANLHWQTSILTRQSGSFSDMFELHNLTDKDAVNLRIAYKLNLHGPSLAIKSSCSSSLSSVHLACRSLLMEEADVMLVGGGYVKTPDKTGYTYQPGMILSEDGKCRPFDKDANGFVGGDGVSFVVLKLLEKALQDNDKIYSVIKSSAINNDGNRKAGFTAPSVKAQAEVINKALRIGDVSPESVSYIETHGSGTQLGDPIEVEAIRIGYNNPKSMMLGSVKSNIGHLDSAAGITGLIKSSLALYNGQIPPTINFTELNPNILTGDTKFIVNNEPFDWKPEAQPRRAGVSAFGIGGTNVHVIVEEKPATKVSKNEFRPEILVFSAKSKKALNEQIEKTKERFAEHKEVNWKDIAYTLSRRGEYNFRSYLVAGENRLALDNTSQLRISELPKEGITMKVVFMFPGHGSQFFGMGKGLYKNCSYFKKTIDECDQIASNYLNIPVTDFISSTRNSDTGERLEDDIEFSQMAIFILEYAMAKYLMHLGIKPDKMIGYSLGEYAAACLSGLISLEDAIKLVAIRGRILSNAPKGRLISVPMTLDELGPLLTDGLSISIDNGDSVIISGKEKNIEEFTGVLKTNRILFFDVNVSHAAHSTEIEGLFDELKAAINQITYGHQSIEFVSNLTGETITKADLEDNYWLRHLTETVQFGNGMRNLLNDACDVFIEVGPGNGLRNIIQRYKDFYNFESVDLVRQGSINTDDYQYFINRFGFLWSKGLSVDWTAFYDKQESQLVNLPSYQFDRTPFEKYLYLGLPQLNGNESGFTLTEPVDSSEEVEETSVSTEQSQVNDSSRLSLTTDYVGPSNTIENSLVKIWEDFFNMPKVGVIDDFFEMGGDSLKAVTLINRIYDNHEAEISLQTFFKEPTIKDIARHVAENRNQIHADIKTVDKREFYPLSATERRMFIMDNMGGDKMAYNCPNAYRMDGHLEYEKVLQALNDLFKHHEILRTTYEIKDETYEIVRKVQDEFTVDLPYLHLDEKGLQDFLENFIQPFDLAELPLFRVWLVKVGDYHVIVTDIHHILTDGYGTQLLIYDFVQAYNGSQITPSVYEYKDFAVWQNEILHEDNLEKQKRYWLGKFQGEITPLSLPIDYEREKAFSFDGSSFYYSMGKDIVDEVNKINKIHSSTTFMVLYAAYNIILMKYSGQEDIIVGSVAEGRVSPKFKSTSGAFVNTIALRTFANHDKTFRTLLKEVKENILESYDNQDYQFDQLLRDLNYGIQTDQNPMFNTMFTLAVPDHEKSRLDLNGIKTSKIPLYSKSTKVDILFMVRAGEDSGINFEINYSSALFNQETMEKFVENYTGILKQVLANIDIEIGDIELQRPPVKSNIEMLDTESEVLEFDFD